MVLAIVGPNLWPTRSWRERSKAALWAMQRGVGPMRHRARRPALAAGRRATMPNCGHRFEPCEFHFLPVSKLPFKKPPGAPRQPLCRPAEAKRIYSRPAAQAQKGIKPRAAFPAQGQRQGAHQPRRQAPNYVPYRPQPPGTAAADKGGRVVKQRRKKACVYQQQKHAGLAGGFKENHAFFLRNMPRRRDRWL